jgi:hypothetical protein
MLIDFEGIFDVLIVIDFLITVILKCWLQDEGYVSQF